MTIYISAQAAQNSIAQEQEYTPRDYGRLTSLLFKDEPTLQKIATSGSNLHLKEGTRGPAIIQLQKALKIVIPEIEGIPEHIKSTYLNLAFTGVYDRITTSAVNTFHTYTLSLPDPPINNVSAKTLQELDAALNRIGFYDTEEGRTIINAGTSTLIEENTVIVIPEPADGTPKPSYIPIYLEPLDKEENKFFYLQENDLVYVKYHLNENTAPGWYFVYVLSAVKSEQDEEGQELFDEMFQESELIKGFIKEQYLWQTWGEGRLPMPDLFASLYKIKPRTYTHIGKNDNNGSSITYQINDSHDELHKIIMENYYRDITISLPYDAFGFENPEEIKIAGRSGTDNTVPEVPLVNSPAYYRFCVNLLVVVNNSLDPTIINTDRALTPKNGLAIITSEAGYNASLAVDERVRNDTAGSSGEELYTTFLDVLDGLGQENYNYIQNGRIQVEAKEGYYMWIPSRQFVESLWLACSKNYATSANTSVNKIDQFSQEAINFIFGARSLGYRMRLQLGATGGILGADFTGDISIWRKDTNKAVDNVLKIVAYGEIGGGLDVGVGAGFSTGANRVKRTGKDIGISAIIGADLKAGTKFLVLVEFEVPITGSDPISQALTTCMYGAAAAGTSLLFPGAAPYAMNMAMKNMNLDLWNYITKFKLYSGRYVKANANLEVDLKYGINSDSPSKEPRPSAIDWSNGSINTSYLAVDKLLSMFTGAVKGDINLSAEMGLGVEVEVEYPYAMEDCYNETHKVRVPSKVVLTAFGEAAVDLNFMLKLSKQIWGLVKLDKFLPSLKLGGGTGLGMKFTIEYDIKAEIDPLNTTLDVVTRDYEMTYEDFISKSTKSISFYQFVGNLDVYEDAAHETEFELRLSELLNGGIKDLILEGKSVNFGDLSFDAVLLGLQIYENIKDIIKKVSFRKRTFLDALSKVPFVGKDYAKHKEKVFFKRSLLEQQVRLKEFEEKNSKGIIAQNTDTSKKVRGLRLPIYIDMAYSAADNNLSDLIEMIYWVIKMDLAINHDDTPDIHKEILQKKLTTLYAITADNVSGIADGQRAYIKKLLSSDDPDTETPFTKEMTVHADAFMVFYEIVKLNLSNLTNAVDFAFDSDFSSFFGEQDERIQRLYLLQLLNYVLDVKDINLSMHVELTLGQTGFKAKAGAGFKARLLTSFEASVLIHSDLIVNNRFYPDSFWNQSFRAWGATLAEYAGKTEIGGNTLSIPPLQLLPNLDEDTKNRHESKKDGSVLIDLASMVNQEGIKVPRGFATNFAEHYLEPVIRYMFDKQQ